MNITTKYSVGISYKMQPPLYIYCAFLNRGKNYHGLILADDELITDSENEIAFIAYVARKDDTENKILKDGFITHAELVIDNDFETPASDYEVVLSDDNQVGTLGKLKNTIQKIRGIIRCKHPLLFTDENDLKLKLIIRGGYTTAGGGKEFQVVTDGILPIRPRFPKPFFKVLPGAEIYTSEIWACIRLFPLPDSLPDWTKTELFRFKARVEESNGFAQLDPSSPEVQTTASKKLGFSKWIIRYSGITWENQHTSTITVKVGMPDRDDDVKECLTYTYNVGRNMADYLREFNDAAPSLNLNNPYFDNLQDELKDLIFPGNLPSSPDPYHIEPGLSRLADYIWYWNSIPEKVLFENDVNKTKIILSQLVPYWPQCKGPFNNLLEMAGTLDKTYVCAELAERIFQWSADRKFGPSLCDPYDVSYIDKAQSMNGVEIAEYAISPAHVFFGFYPSNPNVQAKFIDPWWDQKYDPDTAILTWENELAKTTLFVAPLVAMGAILGGTILSGGGAGALFLSRVIGVLGNMVKYVPAGSLIIAAVINVASKLKTGDYVFSVGEIRGHYMSNQTCYNAYSSDGSVKSSWAGKINHSSWPDDSSYLEPSSLVPF